MRFINILLSFLGELFTTALAIICLFLIIGISIMFLWLVPMILGVLFLVLSSFILYIGIYYLLHRIYPERFLFNIKKKSGIIIMRFGKNPLKIVLRNQGIYFSISIRKNKNELHIM